MGHSFLEKWEMNHDESWGKPEKYEGVVRFWCVPKRKRSAATPLLIITIKKLQKF
jgi:hypothetical protein